MTFDSAVRFCKERKLKIILSIVLIIIICLYLKVFFTTGIYYGDVFLKKEIMNEETYYRGKSEYAEILMRKDSQKSKTEFTFNFFDNIIKTPTDHIFDFTFLALSDTNDFITRFNFFTSIRRRTRYQ